MDCPANVARNGIITNIYVTQQCAKNILLVHAPLDGDCGYPAANPELVSTQSRLALTPRRWSADGMRLEHITKG